MENVPFDSKKDTTEVNTDMLISNDKTNAPVFDSHLHDNSKDYDGCF